MAKDFITFLDYTEAELIALLDLSDKLREAWNTKQLPQHLKGKSIAIAAMGGIGVQIPGRLDERESIEDVVNYLDNWFDGIVTRTRTHEHMLRLASAAQKPVINARTPFNHPCEILGDLAYIRAKRGKLDGLKVVFAGEATNLCHPWFEAAARLPIEVTQVCPEGYEVADDFLAALQRDAVGTVKVRHDLQGALAGADVVYTDCWPKRANPDDAGRVASQFLPYQITADHLRNAAPDVLFLPCPPVTRGEEVSNDAMLYLGEHVYEAKAFLLHAQNAVLTTLLNAG